MAIPILIQLAFVAAILYAVKRRFFDNKQNDGPLPPGPKGLPLVGNVNDLPPPGVPEYQHWLKLKDAYGPLSSVTVMGQTMVIIHDKKIAFELLEKRANIHSGRPKMKFGFDMCGWINMMAGVGFTHTHRLYRKYAYQHLGTKALVAKYTAIQEAAVGRFLWRIANDKGANLDQHLKTEAAEIMLKTLYGYTIEPHKADPLVKEVDLAMGQFSDATVPGKWLVDLIPALEHLPDWMPGTGFKRTARLWNQTLRNVVEVPYAFAKEQTSRSQGDSSFVSRLIQQQKGEDDFGGEAESAIKWTAASLYTGGADTSVSTMAAFFLAMSKFPEVQKKAQGEIDRVVGSTRLPTSNDRENLPYINAIVEEAQRWHPITVMGLPHATDEDDVIDGYRIPKGALLLPAVWWFTRDPAVYHDPETFKPERFLEPHSEPTATSVTFGFGRRRCPGLVLADASLFLTFAQSLAVFDIRKELDVNGKEVDAEHNFGCGIISHPEPFGVRVTARSEKHEQLVKQVLREHPWEDSDAPALESMRV
ncbi:hypothetical protein LTR56_015645 [Elasticomyces elasticus]|nr:hypothetical protein LTR22_026598 [Elasticomyces elasticus]KAK3633731.1 hypothetical protein LTR56_015645 [Elasticomyces elasticus]KAK4914530.1 hypothetical protein LTR49_017223 [Elasticomyces elasticus]KAK5754355.1 hypothetical protein LTS12_015533 [Elasticomyces elasticus]